MCPETGPTDLARLLAQDCILDKLLIAEGAIYNSAEREFAPRCLENTRVDVLSKIRDWFSDPKAPSIFWLGGLAGTGKSTIAHTVAETCEMEERLAASFFFSRDRFQRRSAKWFFSTIARQICIRHPEISPYVASKLRKDPLLLSK